MYLQLVLYIVNRKPEIYFGLNRCIFHSKDFNRKIFALHVPDTFIENFVLYNLICVFVAINAFGLCAYTNDIASTSNSIASPFGCRTASVTESLPLVVGLKIMCLRIPANQKLNFQFRIVENYNIFQMNTHKSLAGCWRFLVILKISI